MSLGFVCKALACFSVAGALISYPYSQVSFPKTRASVILGKSGKGGSDLSLSNMSKVSELLKGSKTSRLSINEAGLKLGNQSVTSEDILINPCIMEDKYYLLKYDGRSKNYKLTNGVSVTNLNCGVHKYLYEKLDYVSLKWAVSPVSSRDRKSYLPTIRLKDCFFYKGDEKHIGIVCNSDSWSERIWGAFESGKYEPKAV